MSGYAHGKVTPILKKRKLLAGFSVLAAFAVSVYALEAARYKSVVNTEKREAKLFAEDLRQSVDLVLLDFESRARGLAAALELSGDIGQEGFSQLAGRFMKPNASILNLAVVEDGTIELVHPFEENRAVVGRNLRDNKDQWPVLDRVQRTGKVAIQGPVALLQGKSGLLVRMPVTAGVADAASSGIKRVVSVVIDAEAVFREALQRNMAPDAPAQAFQAALTTAWDGGDVVGNADVFSKDPATVSFDVQGAQLKLAAAPAAGWGAGYTIAWLPDLAIILTIVLAVYAVHALRSQRAERDKVRLQLNAAIETLPDGFALFDADDRLVACNEKYKELYKQSAPAMVPGARFEDILRFGLNHGQYAEAIGCEEEWLAERLIAHNSANSTIEQELKDGTWLRIYERKMRDGGRVGFRVDITELKRHQAQLEASNTNLRQALAQRDRAEKRFADVAELSRDWVWEMDKDFRFTFLSESVLRGDVSFLVGKTRLEAYKDYPEIFDSADWEWLEEKERAHEPFYDFIYQAYGATEGDKWIRISGLPIFDETGEFAGYRGVGSDISDVYNALREAEAASAAKTEFLNVMSHELRTPLTVVLGYNALLAKPELLPSFKAFESHIETGEVTGESAGQHVAAVKKEVARFAGKMEVAGKHLLTLINDILDLAKIEAGKLKVEPTPIPLAPVIASVADQLTELAQQKSLELKTETGDELVVADEVRLRQILMNLAGNALKFTEHGHVTIRTERRGDDIAIHVEDSGSGIPEDMQELVFGEFDQLDLSSTRQKGGTGLGLPISRKLVELQSGELTLESEVGVGSIFTFTLPAASRGAAEDAAS